jgi:hypothetical protein
MPWKLMATKLYEEPTISAISATMGENVFPLNEIDEESHHFERIHEALSTVMRVNGISQLDRASSNPMFWIMALIRLGINVNSDEIRKQFLVTNDESFRDFCRLVEERLSEPRSADSGRSDGGNEKVLLPTNLGRGVTLSRR